eukprot:TRINITY_DN38633_c0_g1_i1.p1 TRINITY_DN38633_c0_g1~~TRINITY_DN38633_c0_g1_i1.p1  ORF type:complete len:617 (-),score=75.20 TRINITY_DN38633_c0_g1_i1:393-2033(-)
MVDDLGWGDVGFNLDSPDSEVRTPNMDALVASGIHLTRHYVHHTCTPTRSSVQSGRLPVHVTTQLGDVAHQATGIPRNMTGIAEKLSDGGYSTHFVGKWDVGMATPKHTPQGRGYRTSLAYFEQKNDYWTQGCYQSICCEAKPGQLPKAHYNLSIVDLWQDGGPAVGLNGTDYEEFIFERRMHAIIDNHNIQVPLFLFYAPHVVHCPLQVPAAYLDKFSFIGDDEGQCRQQTANVLPENPINFTFSCRRTYRAMVNLLDGVLGRLVGKLKARGLWEDLLIVLTSDNGGPVNLAESAATNHPLRGGKYSNFEGGVRSTAFVSGGFIPRHRRGVKLGELIHVSDWYATLSGLAGEKPDDDLAAKSGLPPVDGLDVWPLLSGQNSTSPRVEVPLSSDVIISGKWKLLLGHQTGAFWQGPHYPNASSAREPQVASLACGQKGCLFDLVEDPTEHTDVRDRYPEVAVRMAGRLAELRPTFFHNIDVGVDSCPPGIDMPCACWMAAHYYGGFFGPFQEVDISSVEVRSSPTTPVPGAFTKAILAEPTLQTVV